MVNNITWCVLYVFGIYILAGGLILQLIYYHQSIYIYIINMVYIYVGFFVLCIFILRILISSYTYTPNTLYQLCEIYP